MSSATLDALERLTAIEDIKQLKARYFRAVDTKDWALMRSVFADDGVLDVSRSMEGGTDASGLFTGPEAIVGYISAASAGATTAHLGVMPEITVHSPTEADGVWKMEDVVIYPDSSSAERHPRMQGVRRLHGFGHYHERYVKAGGAWRIARLELTRLVLELDRG